MAKAPVAGRVKTRLQPAFTPSESASIQEQLIRRTARWAAEVAPGAAYLAYDRPDERERVAALVPHGVRLFVQNGNGLGERLTSATAAVWERHEGPLLVAGVDTRLTADHAEAALAQLAAGADAVFGPALDGGYYLAALARPLPELFALDASEWGGPRVLELTLESAWKAGLRTALIHPERDLDTPADAEALRDDPEIGELLARARTPLVSVVVPTLDEAGALPGLLDHLAGLKGRFEVIVADGGSSDRTTEMAANHALSPTVLRVDGGRAAQLNAAAAAARGDPLLFLHADTRLPPDAYRSLTTSTAAGGNFAIRFDGGDTFSRILGAWYRAQRRLGIYYGDSAIWLTRHAFEALGGFRALPIMDDYDLARRLERRFDTACLPGPVVTSARRWRALGVSRTVLSWVVIRWLFLAGVPPERLAGLYRRAR
jgi:rSAM/selenodomain-associated transferase 2/rSAM/selenodomain-associated transferase 1